MSDNDDLQRQAQEKLAQAHRLIEEAGDLARQGQFYLHFGEIGEFVPSIIDDTKALREKALQILEARGRDNGSKLVRTGIIQSNGLEGQKWIKNPRTPISELSDDEVNDALDDIISKLREDSGISSEALEYADRDQWWAPSRC